jgi:hypothetical protein
MGNSLFSPKITLTQRQEDFKFLADRFPFGDAELHHLYRAYHAILESKREERTSFLVDWSEQCTSASTDYTNTASSRGSNSTATAASHTYTAEHEQLRLERRTLIQVVETKLLPPNFGNRLYEVAFLAAGDASPYADAPDAPTTSDAYTRRARLEKFFEGLSNSGRRGTKAAMTVMFNICQEATATVTDKGTVNPTTDTDTEPRRIQVAELVDMGYRIALATAFLQAADMDRDVTGYLDCVKDTALDETLKALATSIVERGRRRIERTSPSSCSAAADDPYLNQGLVELQDILEWAEAVAPVFASILPTFTFQIFFPGRPYPPSRTAFDFPRILSESTFFSTPSSPLLFTFGCLSSALDGSYYRLYTSAADGLSFNRLQNSLLGYSGPTLLIIRAAGNNGVFGAFTASQWKEQKDFYGNTDCFLYQMAPTTAVYRPTGSARNFMYCNPSARSKGYDQQAHGIGFGGTVDEPRFFIEESFDHCVAGNRDLTFENGSLLPKTASGAVRKDFEIDALEVWGVGGDDVVQQALGARAAARNVKDESIQRARKVDKAAFLDDFRSGLIESKAFVHRGQVQGRADVDLEDKNKTAYAYEK